MKRRNSGRLLQPPSRGERVRLARALSKLGFCSRSEAWDLIKAGRVRVNHVLQRDPERPIHFKRDQIEVDGTIISIRPKVYLMLNKPRGFVTTTADEQGRRTVLECLVDANSSLKDRQQLVCPGCIPPGHLP